MNSALYAKICSHRSPFNGSGRHTGDRSADSVKSDVRRPRKLASKHGWQLQQTFSHGLGHNQSRAGAACTGHVIDAQSHKRSWLKLDVLQRANVAMPMKPGMTVKGLYSSAAISCLSEQSLTT